MNLVRHQLETIINHALSGRFTDDLCYRPMDANYQTIENVVEAQKFLSDLLSVDQMIVQTIRNNASLFYPDVMDCDDYARSLWALFSRIAIITGQNKPYALGYVQGYLGTIGSYHAMNIAVTGTSEANLEVYFIEPQTMEFKYVSQTEGMIDTLLI